MANRRSIQFLYSPHNRATVLDCSFVVDSTNGNGLGIRSLKPSGRIASVYMHTSATPASGNPNPESGIIVVNLQDNYNRYLGGYSGYNSPLTGTNISISGSAVLTVGAPYVITSVGTTTQAQWVAVGLSSSVLAQPGAAFIASVTGGGTGTGTVQAPNSAGIGIDHIETIGDPNTANAYAGQLGGMQFILACYKNGVLTAPNNNAVIGLNFYLNNSAQGV